MAATLQEMKDVLMRDIEKIKANINLDIAPESIYCIVGFLGYSSPLDGLTCSWLRMFETFLGAGQQGHPAFNAGLLAICYTYLYEGGNEQAAKYELLKKEFPVVERAIKGGEERGLDLTTSLIAFISGSLGGQEKVAVAGTFLKYVYDDEDIAWEMHRAFRALEKTQEEVIAFRTQYQPVPKGLN